MMMLMKMKMMKNINAMKKVTNATIKILVSLADFFYLRMIIRIRVIYMMIMNEI